MATTGITFSCVIVQDAETKAFYGMVKEVEGVVVKGESEEEVQRKIPKAIKAIIGAKRKHSEKTSSVLNPKFTVREYDQNYVPC